MQVKKVANRSGISVNRAVHELQLQRPPGRLAELLNEATPGRFVSDHQPHRSFSESLMLRTTLLMTAVLALLFAPKSAVADVDYTKQIQPIFMEHCAGCHGEKKGMGKLRLHTPAAIQEKWEKDEHLIVKSKPDESELFKRLVLPADHKKRMPKKGDPLPKEKIALIRQWIEQGAVFPVVAAAKPKAEADAAPAKDAPAKEEPAKEMPLADVPLPEVGAAEPAALEKLTAAGAQVNPLFAGSSLLQVSYALRGEPATDADVALLADVAEQVYALNLAKAQVSDEGLAVLAKLKNLSQLHLENSSIADSGLAHLTPLANLQYLNLYGTGITDAGLKPLEGLKHLRKLYVWQTKVSYDAAQGLEKCTAGLAVDLGFDHPVIVRKRVTKQLEQAKQVATESDAELKKVQATLDKAKKDQETAKKRLDELQKKMDKLDGKVEPEAKPKEKDKAKPADKVA